jgi:hypothetical protein
MMHPTRKKILLAGAAAGYVFMMRQGVWATAGAYLVTYFVLGQMFPEAMGAKEGRKQKVEGEATGATVDTRDFAGGSFM